MDEMTINKVKKSVLQDLAATMRKRMIEMGDGEEIEGGNYCEECGAELKEGMCPECEGEAEDSMEEEAPLEQPKRPLKGMTVGLIVKKAPMDMPEEMPKAKRGKQ